MLAFKYKNAVGTPEKVSVVAIQPRYLDRNFQTVPEYFLLDYQIKEIEAIGNIIKSISKGTMSISLTDTGCLLIENRAALMVLKGATIKTSFFFTDTQAVVQAGDFKFLFFANDTTLKAESKIIPIRFDEPTQMTLKVYVLGNTILRYQTITDQPFQGTGTLKSYAEVTQDGDTWTADSANSGTAGAGYQLFTPRVTLNDGVVFDVTNSTVTVTKGTDVLTASWSNTYGSSHDLTSWGWNMASGDMPNGDVDTVTCYGVKVNGTSKSMIISELYGKLEEVTGDLSSGLTPTDSMEDLNTTRQYPAYMIGGNRYVPGLGFTDQHFAWNGQVSDTGVTWNLTPQGLVMSFAGIDSVPAPMPSEDFTRVEPQHGTACLVFNSYDESTLIWFRSYEDYGSCMTGVIDHDTMLVVIHNDIPVLYSPLEKELFSSMYSNTRTPLILGMVATWFKHLPKGLVIYG